MAKMNELIKKINEVTEQLDKAIAERQLEIVKVYEGIDATQAEITNTDKQLQDAVGKLDMEQFTALRAKKSELEAHAKALTDFVAGLENSISTLEKQKQTETADNVNALRKEVDSLVKGAAAEAMQKFNEFMKSIDKMYQLADSYNDVTVKMGLHEYGIRQAVHELTYEPEKQLSEVRRGYRPQIGG